MTYLADQKTLYLLRPDMKVWATPTQVRWQMADGVINAQPREGIRDIVLRVDAVIEPSLMKFASKEGKTIAYVDGRFDFIGWFASPFDGKGQLRALQYEFCRDEVKSLAAARQCVMAKVLGQMNLLKELDAQGSFSCPLVESATTKDSLLGMEGAAASAYFYRWPDLLVGSGFEFPGRRRHPAPDPVNAVYDLAISLLANEIFTFASIIGLDPFVGFYHVTTANRPSLVADIIEEWRAPIVDKFVLRCFRRKEFSAEDFEIKDGRCKLKSSSWGKVMAKWSDWYLETERGRNTYQTICFRDLVEGQVRHFARVCVGDDAAYVGHNQK